MPERAYSLYDLQQEIEVDPFVWLATLFPDTITSRFAEHHVEFWKAVWRVEYGRYQPPEINIWNRGGAKSSSAELSAVALGARGARRYCLYICETQDQADDHVGEIATLLESPEIAAFYPALATRRVGKWGAARAWRRNRLWTAAGFVVDAMGLDSAARGAKIDQQRPDLFVLDDIDSEMDTSAATDKKVTIITKRLLPAGTRDLFVIGAQNLVHEDGVFARMADGRATFLADRHVSGPVPAVRDLEVELIDGRYTIVGGEATWEGFDLEACQAFIDRWGISAFLSEAQHETEPPAGGMFDHLDFDAIHVRWEDVPALVATECWCDPAVTNTDQSDSHGVQIDAIGVDGIIYRLYTWERRATPVGAIKTAIRQGAQYGATHVGIETDQGGETWGSVFREAREAVVAEVEAELISAVERDEDTTRLQSLLQGVQAMNWKSAKAGSSQMSKAARAQQWILPEYERPGPPIRHVLGTHNVLERALRRFPRSKPFDACMTPETLITTARGLVRLDAITTDDAVWTRQGWRSVTWAGQTGEDESLLELEVNGRTLTGTPEHPIWTENRGWVPLGKIGYGDILLLWDGAGMDDGKPSPTEASRTTATPTPRTGRTASISTLAGWMQRAAEHSTVRFTRPKSDRSPMAWTSITWTRTRSTTTRRTSSPYRLRTTEPSTDRRGPISTQCVSTWTRFARWLRNGTGARPDASGTASTANGPGSTSRPERSYARSAASRSRPAIAGRWSSAPRNAPTPSFTGSTATIERARSAVPLSVPIATASSGFAEWHVRDAPRCAGVGMVWNLTVEGAHEYVANGVLVHNCDAGAYSLNALRFGGGTGTAADFMAAAQPWRRR